MSDRIQCFERLSAAAFVVVQAECLVFAVYFMCLVIALPLAFTNYDPITLWTLSSLYALRQVGYFMVSSWFVYLWMWILKHP